MVKASSRLSVSPKIQGKKPSEFQVIAYIVAVVVLAGLVINYENTNPTPSQVAVASSPTATPMI
jgi:hypothetical protein